MPRRSRETIAMRRILAFALLAAAILAASVPVALVTAGKAEAIGRRTFTECPC
jgi:hypothetical protein